MSEHWCSVVRQLAPEHYLMKGIIKMDYSDLTQLWTFCYSREDTYIKIIAAILDSASHLERLIQKCEWHFLTCPATRAFTLGVLWEFFTKTDSFSYCGWNICVSQVNKPRIIEIRMGVDIIITWIASANFFETFKFRFTFVFVW